MGSDTLKEDITLWEKCTRGDRAAWDTLVKKYSKLVYSSIWKTLKKFPNPRSPDVDDVYQDVFTKLFEKLNQWKGEASLATWISVITNRTTIDHLRKQKYSYQGKRSDDEDEGAQDKNFLPDERSVDPSDKVLAKELLAKLKGTELAVIRLHFIEDWSLEEIADFLNKKVGAIYTIKSRALEKLRKIGVKIGR